TVDAFFKIIIHTSISTSKRYYNWLKRQFWLQVRLYRDRGIMSILVLDPPLPACITPGLSTVLHLERIKNIFNVKSNGTFFDQQSQRDLAVRAALRDQFQHFKFTSA